MPPTPSRLVSIDFIRICAMLFICISHAAGGTGLMPLIKTPANQVITLGYVLFTHIGVNLFVLISGYCGVLTKPNSSRYFKLWLQAVFFTLIFLPFAIANGYCDTPSKIAAEVLPIPLAGGYWFLTAYTGLFILSPYLNQFIKKLNIGEQYTHLIAILFLFCILNTGTCKEIAGDGYNVVWMCAVYVMGAIFRLNPPQWRPSALIIALLLALFLQMVQYTFSKYVPHAYFPHEILPTGYTSPFNVIQAVAFFLIIVRVDMQQWKIARLILFLSPLMFGVYLFHMDSYFFSTYIVPTIRKLFIKNNTTSIWSIPVAGCLIFAAGIAATYVQVFLFKLIKADELATKIAKLWKKLASKCKLLLFQ